MFHREIRSLTLVIRKTKLSQGNQLTFENQIWFRNDILKGFFIDKLRQLRLAFFAQHLCLGHLGPCEDLVSLCHYASCSAETCEDWSQEDLVKYNFESPWVDGSRVEKLRALFDT